jgi:large exoprotein involved in heme utilization and adhesion
LSGFNPNTLGPSAISSSTGFGSAGNVILNTSKLFIENGGRVDSSTFASGSGGSVLINASEFVEVKGTVTGSLNPSLIISSANILDELFRQTFELPGVPTLTGDSGNVTINTQRLMVLDGALISVRNDGTGNAGNVVINAPFTQFKSGGVSAATASGLGGDIQINSQALRLQNNSNITTTAAGIGDGGNITIDTDTLITLENSNITANAFSGSGGSITINAQGVFSDRPISETFNASSELGIDGTVTINSPEIDIQKELEQLNPQVVPIEQVIAKSCLTERNARRGGFISSGNGGLPVTPETPIDEFALDNNKEPIAHNTSSQLTNQSENTSSTRNERTQANNESSSSETVYISSVTPWKPGDPIIAGQKLVRTDDGRLLFVAEASTQTLESAKELVCY